MAPEAIVSCGACDRVPHAFPYSLGAHHTGKAFPLEDPMTTRRQWHLEQQHKMTHELIKCRQAAILGARICFHGLCLPVPADHKPKTDHEIKLRTLLQNYPVPSALAGARFQMVRRFRLGRSSANRLETSVFSPFSQLSPVAQQLTSCSLRRFDALTPEGRHRPSGPGFSTRAMNRSCPRYSCSE
jgi:hypothetical protein